MLSADLVLRGVGSAAALGTAGGLGFCWSRLNHKMEKNIKVLTRLVGLNCTGYFDRKEGVSCTIAPGRKVRVKKGNENFEASTLSSTGNKGKIKVYRVSEDEKYKDNLKFVIEKDDITVDDGGNKLEEYETYTLKRRGVWRMELMTTVDEGIKKELRLPEGCNLPTETGEEGKVECSLSAEDFKNINFDYLTIKDENFEITSKLKIYKVEGANNDYGQKYKFKFVLESDKDTTTYGSSGTKPNTNTEFKIKTIAIAGTTWDKLSLEKAWNVKSLGAKVGLDCKMELFSSNECSFTPQKINLYNDENNHVKGGSLSSSETTKKIKYEKDQEGYNQGFKFYVGENTDITLENGTTTDGGEKKIEKKGENGFPTYEIKMQTVGEETDWYLSKVTSVAQTQVVQQQEPAQPAGGAATGS